MMQFSFLDYLEKDAKEAGKICRTLANTYKREGQVKEEKVYAGESEAVFKAILYCKLSEHVPKSSLSLEPLKVFHNVDMVYRKKGLIWKESSYENTEDNFFIEIKEIWNKPKKIRLFKNDINGIQDDVKHLVKITRRHNTGIAIVAFMGYDFADIEPKDLEEYNHCLTKVLEEASRQDGKIRLIVC